MQVTLNITVELWYKAAQILAGKNQGAIIFLLLWNFSRSKTISWFTSEMLISYLELDINLTLGRLCLALAVSTCQHAKLGFLRFLSVGLITQTLSDDETLILLSFHLSIWGFMYSSTRSWDNMIASNIHL